MFDKILVPLDGSALATCVLPHVVAMTQALRSDLTLLRVLEGSRILEGYDAPGGGVNPMDWQYHKAEAHAYLNALGGRLDQHLDRSTHLQTHLQTVEGPAATGIIEYAQRYAFDLVALSSHGHGGLNGWNLSSVVQKVIDRARKSILLVRAYNPTSIYAEENWDAFRYRRILVPLDGSQRAEFVLPMATELAHYHEAELLLVHVVAQPEISRRLPQAAEDTARWMERSRAQASQSFAALQARLPLVSQLRIQVSTNVAATLHSLVEQEEADLVVLSAHGHSCQTEWPYGSIATSFLTHGTTPLLLMQDLLPHEILLSRAERMAADTQPYGNAAPERAPGHRSPDGNLHRLGAMN